MFANNSTARLDCMRWGMANICGEVVKTCNLKVGWSCWGIAENNVNEVIFHSLEIVAGTKKEKICESKATENYILPKFKKKHFCKNVSIKTSNGYH